MKRLLLAALFFTAILFGCKSSIVDDPSLSIRYSVPEESMVKLTIENSYDTIIQTPVDTKQIPGVYEVIIDVSDLAEGVYFYTVELKGTNSNYYFKSTKQVLLVK